MNEEDLGNEVSYQYTDDIFSLFWGNDVVVLTKEQVIKLLPVLKGWVNEET